MKLKTKMGSPNLNRILAAGLFILVVICISTLYIINNETVRLLQDTLPPEGFLVHMPGCKIPDVDPYDISIRHLVQQGRPIACNATPALTYIDDNVIRINKTALKLYYSDDMDSCMYQTIHRLGEESDDLFTYGNRTIYFKRDISTSSEFVRVACYNNEGHMMYTNFHAFILKKTQVEKRCKHNFNKFLSTNPVEKYNLLIIGVDSISRLNFMRQMPKTREFLVDKLQAVELKGYNKVADNTYVNLVPMFAGKFVEELPWDESNNKPFDEYNFIWKNFSSHGYRTLYAEDAPKIAIFNYAKEGFHKQPTDYYLRPFSLALEDHGSLWKNNHDCVGPKLETDIVLDWTEEFMLKFKSDPFYAFAFLTRLTHDGINKVGAADDPYYEFMKRIHKKGLLENTILFFFSDHGMRFGQIRETYIGKLEERLPIMFIVFPPTFYAKYPHLEENLRINSHRLTTPFDIYETLTDILHFTGSARSASVNQRGISLFSAIPTKRTCEKASILPHWCTCHQQESVSRDDGMVFKAAMHIVETINTEISIYGGKCAPLALESITDALKILPNENILKFRGSFGDVIGRMVKYGSPAEAIVDYLLTFRTKPGGGLFESTVRHDASLGLFSILGDISRINEYGEQGSCLNTHTHAKYCYCT